MGAWGADQHARFWPRRMLHETTMHRVDAELATGTEPLVDRALAADGINELLENLPSAAYFRPRVAELRGDDESIALRSTERGDGWLINLEPDGFRWKRGDGAATATVTAATGDLLMLVYGRRAMHDDPFELVGDARVLERWLERSAL